MMSTCTVQRRRHFVSILKKSTFPDSLCAAAAALTSEKEAANVGSGQGALPRRRTVPVPSREMGLPNEAISAEVCLKGVLTKEDCVTCGIEEGRGDERSAWMRD